MEKLVLDFVGVNKDRFPTLTLPECMNDIRKLNLKSNII